MAFRGNTSNLHSIYCMAAGQGLLSNITATQTVGVQNRPGFCTPRAGPLDTSTFSRRPRGRLLQPGPLIDSGSLVNGCLRLPSCKADGARRGRTTSRRPAQGIAMLKLIAGTYVYPRPFPSSLVSISYLDQAPRQGNGRELPDSLYGKQAGQIAFGARWLAQNRSCNAGCSRRGPLRAFFFWFM